MIKRLTLYLLMIISAVMLSPCLVTAQQAAPGTDILWDEWGVPHI